MSVQGDSLREPQRRPFGEVVSGGGPVGGGPLGGWVVVDRGGEPLGGLEPTEG